MLKWYDHVGQEKNNNYISSRVRLVRNWDDYAFPSKLSVIEGQELIQRLDFGLQDIGKLENDKFSSTLIYKLSEIDRLALRERRILNSAIVAKQEPAELVISENEGVSFIFNGDDHIRIQLLTAGMHLDELWSRADKIDDYINERFSYAFDNKYGYLTSFPTNVGTGMRANVVVHLPALSLGKRFQNLIGGMTRFGVTIRGVYGEGRENYGDLYDISNAKTLGLCEKEILDIVAKVASQLNSQENEVRERSIKDHRLDRLDETYKSYGVLKYARRLTLKDTLVYLSQVMSGISDGLIELKVPCSVYSIMLGIQPSNLCKSSQKPLNKEELDVARAEYVRRTLPDIKEV